MLKSETGGDSMDFGQKAMVGLIIAVILVGGYLVLRPNSDSEDEIISDNLATGSSVLAPVVDGETTYTLDSLVWVFEPQAVDESGASTTRVRLKLEGFKKNDVPIEVGLYRLGTYRGTCEPLILLPEQRSASEVGSFALTQCLSGGNGRQLAVFQEGNNLVVKVRTISDNGSEESEFVSILTIDITEIVEEQA